jgi:hypothetical protein
MNKEKKISRIVKGMENGLYGSFQQKKNRDINPIPDKFRT